MLNMMIGVRGKAWSRAVVVAIPSMRRWSTSISTTSGPSAAVKANAAVPSAGVSDHRQVRFSVEQRTQTLSHARSIFDDRESNHRYPSRRLESVDILQNRAIEPRFRRPQGEPRWAMLHGRAVRNHVTVF